MSAPEIPHIGQEPTSGTPRDVLGHAGRLFHFTMLATGEIVESQNVWYQGRIPVEYRSLLPDNATVAPNDREPGRDPSEHQQSQRLGFPACTP